MTIINPMTSKVLILDDEESVRKVIRLHLSAAGYEVLEAENGQKGIEILNDADHPLSIESIICDIRMPKVNGIEAIDYFRREYPSIPVIVVTGYPDVNLAVDLMKKGVVEYLVKPVEKEKLIEAVRKAKRSLYKE